ncbi:choice-of-anchor I family protein [Demequina lignilytica]|uniref:Choice-of-anchor I family protein n=1 Tax=Demequina lignilytica TaxID=3051663 RepID=A0AB35MJV9_9MICO|nr:choice-of-anchor I family protein [Demequina sp. SYSU T0a273]MDN4484048.1 choice-of-anchor I family protein [Demequina sp. SYSU T0a273]
MSSVPAPRPTGRRVLAACAVAAAGAAVAVPASAAVVDDPISWSAPSAKVALSPAGSYETAVFDESAAEIVAFHAASAQLYSVDANEGKITVLDASDPADPTFLYALSAAGVPVAGGGAIPAGSEANSVAVRADGLVAVAVEAPTKTDAGWVAFFDADGSALGAVEVGAQPDMVTITPDGTMAVTADEGEPNDDYDVDPEGTVSVIDLPADVAAPAQTDVRTADFHAFEGDALPDGVRVFMGIEGIDHPVSRNLEPEYVAVDAGSSTAYVSVQEANAVAVVDLATATVTELLPLGSKDHSTVKNGIDPSDRDDAIAIQQVPVRGMYQPDSIAVYTAVNGTTYLVTANEGDSRDDWGATEESVRVKDLGDDGLAPLCEGVLTEDQLEDETMGRLTVSSVEGLSADGSCYEELYSFGSRSFSVWTTDGDLIFDSGDEFEQITAAALPDFFNSSNDETELDSRSDAKGPEPEGVTIGQVGTTTYAFIGLERVGGVMVYDITNPHASRFVTYVNNRDFLADPESSAARDLGPEGLAFIAASDSPTGVPLLAVGNEVSGTTTLFTVAATK